MAEQELIGAGDKADIPPERREYLAVPYKDRIEAGHRRAKWDPEQKLWSIGPRGTRTSLAKWLPENTAGPGPVNDPREEFAAVLRELGADLSCQHPIIKIGDVITAMRVGTKVVTGMFVRLAPQSALSAILAACLLLASQTQADITPIELPALEVDGYYETNYGYIWATLSFTDPWQDIGIQNFWADDRYGTARHLYGRMTSMPPRLVGPRQYLGQPKVITVSAAKIDTDGDPNERGYDKTWAPATAYGYNAAVTPFVVLTNDIAAFGVGKNDWAQITVYGAGGSFTIWAIVGDYGQNNPHGEISEAAAAILGIEFLANSYTIVDRSVAISFYPHSAGK